MRGGFSQSLPMQHDLGAPGGGPGHFCRRSEFRHDDRRRHAQQLRMPGHRLGVVSRRHGDDAASPLIRAQQRQAVRRSTLLESAGDLEIFEFQDDVGARGGRDGFTGYGRRAQNLSGQALRGRLNVGERDHADF